MEQYNLSREEILYEFSVEEKINEEVLNEYQQRFPEFSKELLDLYYEIESDTVFESYSLSSEDINFIDEAWKKHVSSVPTYNPFENQSVNQLRQVAKTLDVPRNVITAFQDSRLLVKSVPEYFLKKLAKELGSTIEQLILFLSSSSSRGLVNSYKSDVKPSDFNTKVTFEKVLIDAGFTGERLESILNKKE